MKRKKYNIKKKVAGNKRQKVKKQRKKIPWPKASALMTFFLKGSFFLAGLTLISFLFLSAYQYLITSPYVKLDEIVMTGVEDELKYELIKASQLSTEMNLIAVRLNEVENRLEAHPWVKDADVKRDFPHTLVIDIKKEIPWALVAFEKLVYLNEDGEFFKEVELKDNLDYPVITGISGADYNLREKLNNAIHVLNLLAEEKGIWSLDRLAEINVGNLGRVSLYSMDISAVVRVNVDELDSKKDDLKKIETHLTKSGRMHLVQEIDLNYKKGVVVSFQKS